MNTHIHHTILWFCTCVLSLVLAGVTISCAADTDKNPTSVYYNAGNTCNDIDTSKQYTPEDEKELKQLIQKDINERTAYANLNYIDTSGITDMSSLFETEEGATFNGAINCWDVSGVTTMRAMFKGTKAFNQDISDWNIGSVAMESMFEGAEAFNQPIENWNVSEVTTMKAMFKGATAFNQDIKGWDVGAVTTMESMFEGAGAFDRSLADWKEHVQSTVNTASMFANAPKVTAIPDWKEAGVCFAPTAHATVIKDGAALKAKIDAEITADKPSPNLNYLETCNVTDMSELFMGKTTFNGDISQWDVSKVTTMQYMFYNAHEFNQDISNWNVTNMEIMENMFTNAKKFNQPIGGWNVSNVKNMKYMFSGTEVFDQPIGDWNVGNVEDMSFMFTKAEVFDQPIGDWNVSKVTTMANMFASTQAFNQDISNWDVSNVTTMEQMFISAKAFDIDLKPWGEHVSSTVNTDLMFTSADKITSIPDWKSAGVCFAPTAHATVIKDGAALKAKVSAEIIKNANVDLNYLETCNVTNMSGIFSGQTAFNGYIDQWDVSNVTSMYAMFDNAHTFNRDITGWDTSNVTHMTLMFQKAFSFNQDFSNWNINSLGNVNGMLRGARDKNFSLCNSIVTRWNEKLAAKGITADHDGGVYSPLANC